MTNAQHRASIEEVLAEFDRRQDILTALCAKTKNLIEASLQDASIPYQSVQARVKAKKKLRAKYLDPEKDYRCLDDITDQAGLRVITYYEDDVDRVSEIIKREFDLDHENSVGRRETEPDRFGYSAANFVCRHSAKRTSDVEYKKFAGIVCEVQIASILSHAWSEIEHEWYDLKDAYPAEIKRRFSRLAALFDLAGSEFLEIKKARAHYEQSVALRVEAKVPDLPIDAVSLRSFVDQEPLVAEIDKALGSVLGVALSQNISDSQLVYRSKALKLAGFETLQELSGALARFRTAIPEFVRRCKKEAVWPLSSASSLPKGIRLHQLAQFSVSAAGVDASNSYYKEFGFPPGVNLVRQVAIAKEIASGYSV